MTLNYLRTPWLRTSFLVLLAFIMLFNYKAIYGSFFADRDPNEILVSTIVWARADGTLTRTSFGVPKGYYDHGNNYRGEVGGLTLNAMYPSRDYVPIGATPGPNLNQVYLYISRSEPQTLGDKIKSLIDDDSLTASLMTHRKIERIVNGVYTLSRTPPDRDGKQDDIELFFDPKRNHWIVQDAFGDSADTLRRGSGNIAHKNIRVHYQYRNGIEANPIVMYHWAMDFAESLQLSEQALVQSATNKPYGK